MAFPFYTNQHHAKIAQLVEHDLAKVGVAGSSPVFRSNESGGGRFFSIKRICSGGEIGIHATLRGWWADRPCEFESHPEHVTFLFRIY